MNLKEEKKDIDIKPVVIFTDIKIPNEIIEQMEKLCKLIQYNRDRCLNRCISDFAFDVFIININEKDAIQWIALQKNFKRYFKLCIPSSKKQQWIQDIQCDRLLKMDYLYIDKCETLEELIENLINVNLIHKSNKWIKTLKYIEYVPILGKGIAYIIQKCFF
jgi:hypothetical protein